jgi:hypothetical protein
MRSPRAQKTAAQLVREIAYYAAILKQTTSADRITRAHKAIQIRERQLVEARRAAIAPPTSITCPRCHLVSYHPSDIRERYCGYCHRFHADPDPEARP